MRNRLLVVALAVFVPMTAKTGSEKPGPQVVTAYVSQGIMHVSDRKLQAGPFALLRVAMPEGIAKASPYEVSSSYMLPFRFHITKEHAWVLRATMSYDFRYAGEGIERIPLTKLHERNVLYDPPVEDKGSWEVSKQFLSRHRIGGPLSFVHSVTRPSEPASEKWEDFRFQVHADFLPVRRDAVRLLALHNFRVDLKAKSGRRSEEGLIQLVHGTPDGPPEKPQWMFGVWEYRGKDERTFGGDLAWSEWSWVEEIEVAFTEPFHVFGKGDDYYFVTDSGKLYISRKPVHGKRTMEEVWVNDNWPIRFVIDDVDRGRTFAFGRKVEDNRTHFFYFELSDKPDMKSFDPDALKPVKAEGDLGTVLRYSQLILPPAT